ncbi:MAG: hypothetical protein ACXWVJ_08920 [Caulobacteraceae bacterium]
MPSPNGGNGRHRQRGPIVATYDYHDEAGKLLFQACRTDPKDFFQRRPNGRGGWINNLDGVRRVPYRLPEMLARPEGAPVYVVEGEKDANRLTKLGLCATTTPAAPAGAGASGGPTSTRTSHAPTW